jgi:hypothetical protein
MNAITGHQPETVGDSYGHYPVDALHREPMMRGCFVRNQRTGRDDSTLAIIRVRIEPW